MKTITRRNYHITFQSFWVVFIWQRKRNTFSYYILALLKYMKLQVLVFPVLYLHFLFHQPSPSHESKLFQGLIFAFCTSLLSSLAYPNHIAVALQALHQFLGCISLECICSRVFKSSVPPYRVHRLWTCFILWHFCPWQSWLPVPTSPSSVHLGQRYTTLPAATSLK